MSNKNTAKSKLIVGHLDTMSKSIKRMEENFSKIVNEMEKFSRVTLIRENKQLIQEKNQYEQYIEKAEQRLDEYFKIQKEEKYTEEITKEKVESDIKALQRELGNAKLMLNVIATSLGLNSNQDNKPSKKVIEELQQQFKESKEVPSEEHAKKDNSKKPSKSEKKDSGPKLVK